MNPEIRTFVDSADYCRASVEKLATMLPPDDTALDQLIADTVSAPHAEAFVFVVMAAFLAKRPVQAHHLAGGLGLMPDHWTLGLMAEHMQGDVGTALMEGIARERCPEEVLPAALYLSARWQRDHQQKIAPPLVAAARTAARKEATSKEQIAFLRAMAQMADDAALNTLTLKFKGERIDTQGYDKGTKEFAEQMVKLWRTDPVALLPAAPRKTLAEGTTMRRAVAKVGRNDPCPCGSKKKYKQCCINKDQERLRHSTHVAGVTDAELAANPEPYLTALSFDTADPNAVARYDPLKIDPQLYRPYFSCLCRARLLEPCAAALEKLGFREDLIEVWEEVSIRMAQMLRRDLIERMRKIDGYLAKAKKLGAVEILLSEKDPAATYQALEEQFFFALRYEDPKGFKGPASTLMKGRLAPFGILIARGLIPLLPEAEATQLHDEILQARDKLGLSPDDPISDVMDERLLKHRAGENQGDEALAKAQRRFEAKVQEVQRYKESVERLQKELARREQMLAQPAAATPQPVQGSLPPPSDSAVTELREKVESLKNLLKQTHNERNQFRRELRDAQEENNALRQHPSSAVLPVAGEPDHEEDLLLPQEAESSHPIRIVEFPPGFQAKLASLPRSVSRGTMIMAGRLAAGEAAAFVGAVRLKAIPSIMRQRMGIDFRLLFRLLPERLQIIDLIPRQDLERRIKTLQ